MHPSDRTAESDLEALVFVMLAEAADSAQEDVARVIAALKAITASKQRLRGVLSDLDQQSTPASDDSGWWRLVRDELLRQLDALSELSEAEAQRLQMIMDRRSKFVETLSNILKKIEDTEDSIVKNLK